VIRLGSTLLVNRVRLAQALGSSYDGTPAAVIGGRWRRPRHRPALVRDAG
jgi:hypothetical protein